MNEVWLSKGEFDQTAWHIAAGRGHIEVLEKLWDWVKELQLKQEELMNEVWLSKGEFNRTAWHVSTVCGHVDILGKLWDWAKDRQLNPLELRNEVWLSKTGLIERPCTLQ
jgi:ankyrin repeat protein